MPRVSVILSVFNGEEYVSEAISSILSDGYDDFEVIVIDDGSTDRTPAILDTFRPDRRIRILRKPNTGLTDSLNFGIARANGEYVARLDADDLSYPGRLGKQLRHLDVNRQCALVGSNFYVLNAKSQRITKSQLGHLSHQDCVSRLRKRISCMPHSSWMVRASVLSELGGYDKFFQNCEDYDFSLRCSEHHELTCLPDHFIGLRRIRNSISYESSFSQYRLGTVALLRHLGRVGELPEARGLSNCDLLDMVNRWFANEKLARRVYARHCMSFARYHFLSKDILGASAEMLKALFSDPLIVRSQRGFERSEGKIIEEVRTGHQQ